MIAGHFTARRVSVSPQLSQVQTSSKPPKVCEITPLVVLVRAVRRIASAPQAGQGAPGALAGLASCASRSETRFSSLSMRSGVSLSLRHSGH